MSSPLCCKIVIKWISATLYLFICLNQGYLISQHHCNCFVFLKNTKPNYWRRKYFLEAILRYDFFTRKFSFPGFTLCNTFCFCCYTVYGRRDYSLNRESLSASKFHMQLHLYVILRKNWNETNLVALIPVLSKGIQTFLVFSKDLYYQPWLSIFSVTSYKKWL